jgi:hypothetical protein
VLDLFDFFSIFYSLQSDLFDFRMDWIWFAECHVKCSSWYVFVKIVKLKHKKEARILNNMYIMSA